MNRHKMKNDDILQYLVHLTRGDMSFIYANLKYDGVTDVVKAKLLAFKQITCLNFRALYNYLLSYEGGKITEKDMSAII